MLLEIIVFYSNCQSSNSGLYNTFGKQPNYQQPGLAEVSNNTVLVAHRGFYSYTTYNLRDLVANMMSELCKDTEIEPKPTSLSGRELYGRTSNILNEARVEIKRTYGFREQK